MILAFKASGIIKACGGTNRSSHGSETFFQGVLLWHHKADNQYHTGTRDFGSSRNLYLFVVSTNVVNEYGSNVCVKVVSDSRTELDEMVLLFIPYV